MEQLSQENKTNNILSKIEPINLEIVKEIEKLQVNLKHNKARTNQDKSERILSDERQKQSKRKSKSTKKKTHLESELSESNKQLDDEMSQNASLKAETNSMRIKFGQLKCELHQILGLNKELRKEHKNLTSQIFELISEQKHLNIQSINELAKKIELVATSKQTTNSIMNANDGALSS